MKKTKIVSTLGPASNDVETITKLAEAGANVFRFNFSHGDHEEHRARMNMVREVEKKTGKLLGIALDTKGAEIRTTEQEGGKFTINTGDTIRISMDSSVVSVSVLRFSFSKKTVTPRLISSRRAARQSLVFRAKREIARTGS